MAIGSISTMVFTQNLHKTIEVKVICILTNRKTWIVKWHHFGIKALSAIIEASIFFLIRSSLEAEKSSSNVFCVNCVKKDVKCFSSIYLLCNKEVVPSIFVESVFFSVLSWELFVILTSNVTASTFTSRESNQQIISTWTLPLYQWLGNNEVFDLISLTAFILFDSQRSELTRFYSLNVKIYYWFIKTFREVENLTLQEAFQLKKQHFIYRMKKRVQQTKDRRFDENYGLTNHPLRKKLNRKTIAKNNINRSKTVNPGKGSFI